MDILPVHIKIFMVSKKDVNIFLKLLGIYKLYFCFYGPDCFVIFYSQLFR